MSDSTANNTTVEIPAKLLKDLVRYQMHEIENGLEFLWESPWRDEGKYQYQNIYFNYYPLLQSEPSAKPILCCINIQRSGSYFTEYDYTWDWWKEDEKVAVITVSLETYLLERLIANTALTKAILLALYHEQLASARELLGGFANYLTNSAIKKQAAKTQEDQKN